MSKGFSDWWREHVNPMKKPNIKRLHYRDNFTPATLETTHAIIMALRAAGYKEFSCEVVLKNGLRPDIVCPDLSTPVIEIMDSETEKMFAENKKAWYDRDGITVLQVPARPEEAVRLLKEANGLK